MPDNDEKLCPAEHEAATEMNCKKCGVLVTPMHAFCSECGEPIVIQTKKLCSKCQTELVENQMFCPTCGQRTDLISENNTDAAMNAYNMGVTTTAKRKFVKPIIFGSIGAFVIIVSLVLFFVIQNASIKQYKENAKSYSVSLINAAANLEKVGNQVSSNWYTYIYDNGYYYKKFDSIDDAIQKALITKSTEVSIASTQKQSLETLYAKLKKPPVKNNEIQGICDAVQSAHDSYLELYDCVITPSGSYLSFKPEFSTKDDNVVKKYKELDELLK